MLRHLHERGVVDCLVVTSQGAVEALAEVGIASTAVPIGRHEVHGCYLASTGISTCCSSARSMCHAAAVPSGSFESEVLR